MCFLCIASFKGGRVYLSWQYPEDGCMAWHRDSVSGSGLLLVFQVFIKKWENGPAGHRGRMGCGPAQLVPVQQFKAI